MERGGEGRLEGGGEEEGDGRKGQAGRKKERKEGEEGFLGAQDVTRQCVQSPIHEWDRGVPNFHGFENPASSRS